MVGRAQDSSGAQPECRAMLNGTAQRGAAQRVVKEALADLEHARRLSAKNAAPGRGRLVNVHAVLWSVPVASLWLLTAGASAYSFGKKSFGC